MANFEVDELKKKRKNAKSSLTRFKNFIIGFKVETDEIEDLKARVNRIGGLLDEFIAVQNEITSFNVNDDESPQEIENFESSFFAAIGQANRLITERVRLVSSVSVNTNRASSVEGDIPTYTTGVAPISSRVKLPTINIPSFSGAYEQWLNFRDTYKSLIHDNAALPKIQKFYYLRSALSGEAADQIHSMETTEANYDVAWELLQERYENQNLIISSHITAIFEIPPLQRESYLGLRQLHAGIEKHLRSLKALGLPTESWDMIIIHIIVSKLDQITLRDWKGLKYSGKLPTVKEMLKFLNERCQVLRSINDNSQSNNKANNSINLVRARQSTKTLLATDNESCTFCKSTHFIKKCSNFLKLPINTRIQEARKLMLCLNCLKRGHRTRDCKGHVSCNICSKRHSSILHLESFDSNINSPAIPEISASNTIVACSSNEPHKRILLATALIKIVDLNGKSFDCRALLDSASQSNFITQRLCDKLKLKLKPTYIRVSGIGDGATKVNKSVNICIHSRMNSFKAKLSCLVLDRITENVPGVSFECTNMNIPDDLALADPGFNESSSIDLLIGASLFWDLLCQGQVRLGHNLPFMQKTYFGWIVSGPIIIPKQTFQNTLCHFSANENIDQQLCKFWEVEEKFLETKPISITEQACEDHFRETTFRNSSGQFVVSIPFESFSSNMLGDSREMAANRFCALERKLAKDVGLKLQYHDFMREYIDLGHMTEVKDNSELDLAYYLPHHPVIKPTSLTTKLRVVFDASAKTTNGKSLNDVQLVGPTIQRDIFAILLHFRQYRFAITADIAKMYRMVLVAEKHRSLQRIFWRFDSSASISCYQLNTVTYGTASASYLAIRCLCELARIHESDSPLISRIIRNCFSVDDLLAGADSLSELIYMQVEMSRILSSAGFELRKWSSNSDDFLNFIRDKQSKDANFIIGSSEESKTLGLVWNRSVDVLSFSVNIVIKGSQVTKRQILSCIAQIFDPLGLITPVTTNVKVILQRLWQLKLSWDESIPLDLRTKWLSLKDGFSRLGDFQIPRHVMCINPVRVELLAFCDASETAYGACTYIRSTDKFSNCTIRLLSSKGRVAPLKRLSIPRLELCAAVALSQLVVKVRNSLNITFDAQYYWSDSTIVLSWIRGCSSKWKTFVANRVTEIQGSVSTSDWYHVSGVENPADLLSRGLDPLNLVNSKLWWHGPQWLVDPIENWPLSNVAIDEDSIPEQKSLVLMIVDKGGCDIFIKFSSLSKMRRVIAYCLRFIKNAKGLKEGTKSGCLSTAELQTATLQLVKLAQNECFSREINSLHQGRNLHPKSSLLPLSPFLDSGILRVGGRLRNSDCSYGRKHPILLPKGHLLTGLIIKNEHERLLHAGPQATLASLRERYWPVAGRAQVRGVIKKCFRCFRADPKAIATYMGDLPAARVAPIRPFLQCGVDYAGPFLLRDRKTRGAKLIKSYICLFICFATKAIHLELVGDLTSNSFLAALRRFSSRRGKPSNIHSDNGTNFIGADRELSELCNFLKNNEKLIVERSNNDGIQWHFIPPRAPHFGGLWEAGVKSAKTHLKRVMASANLTYEEFNTIIVQIEGCLNSRPLSPLSSDPDDLLPLTPAHFLIGESLATIPDPGLLHIPENRLSKFQKIQQLTQHFWKRWSSEYLSYLQARSKWKTKGENLQLGTLVILKEDNVAPAQWRLGRIVQAHPGIDGVARVFTVQTSTGACKRALTKLCPLP